MLPVWPLLISVSMLVQECSGGTLFSEIMSIKIPFSLICLVLKHPFLGEITIYLVSVAAFQSTPFLRSPDILKTPPFFWFLCPWILHKFYPFLRDFLDKHGNTFTWEWPHRACVPDGGLEETQSQIGTYFTAVK